MNNINNNYNYEIVPRHYYGDTVRMIFIIAGLFMIVSYPFFSKFVDLPIIVSLVAVIILVVFGGMTNPKQKWVQFANVLISIGALLIFQYYTIQIYLAGGPTDAVFFWSNQALSVLFFFSTYLSIKSLRGLLLQNK